MRQLTQGRHTALFPILFTSNKHKRLENSGAPWSGKRGERGARTMGRPDISPMHISQRTAITAIGAALLAALLAFAVSSGTDRAANATSASGEQQAASQNTKAERSFSVFDQKAPKAAGNPFTGDPTPLTDVKSERARQLRSAKAGWQLWTAPGDKYVCLSAKGPKSETGNARNCGLVDQTMTNGLFGVSHPAPSDGLPAGTAELSGMLPDGVETVTVQLAGGGSARAPVVDNAIAETFAVEPTGVTWVDGAGVERRQQFDDE